MRKHTTITVIPGLFSILILLGSCKKLLEIDPPLTTVTTEEMFANNRQAEFAIAGIYSKMINGTSANLTSTAVENYFSAGLTTMLAALSADEFVIPTTLGAESVALMQNKIIPSSTRRTDIIWNTAYRTVFDATAVIEGIDASTSSELAASVKNQITGEALALRAFSYFYLVNFFGDVPLVLTSDSKKNQALSRAPVAKVYEQIIADLVRARSLLSSDFSFTGNEKVRINKWFAEGLLARVYLYTKQYQLAINSATEVINQKALFDLETDLAKVFLKGSKEAIFQLKQNQDDAYLKNGTPEGQRFLQYLNTIPGYVPDHRLSEQLSNSFELNDKRKTIWTITVPGYNIPAKYKNGVGMEYYVVMRVAEMYLIRAEAIAEATPGNVNTAIDDLNLLRRRANITELDKDLPVTAVKDTIAHERRIELFAEWGHRWFDLKRTNKATIVLPAVSYKQPWLGDYQFLYPIPETDIKRNGLLEQNPEYNNL